MTVSAFIFVDGQRVQRALSLQDAMELGWTRVDLPRHIRKPWWLAHNRDTPDIPLWLHDNVDNGLFYFNYSYVYFWRESDATAFILRWL